MTRSRSHTVRTVAVLTVGVAFVTTWLTVPVSAAGRWSAPRSLFATEVSSIPLDSSRSGPAIQVRNDSAGNSIATWIQQLGDVCQAKWASRPFGGSWSSPKNLAAPMNACPFVSGGLMSLAMNKKGQAIVAWVDRNAVVAATRPGGGSFGTPTPMPATANTTSTDATAAISATGAVAVAWTEPSFNFGSPTPLKARVRPAGGSYSDVETLTTTGGASSAKLAIESGGAVTAVWARSYNPDLSTTRYAIETAYRPAGGHFPTSPNQTLDDYAVSSGILADPQLALDENNRATAAWILETGSKGVVRTAAKIAGSSTFGSAQTINAADTGSSKFPRLALDTAANTAHVVWLQCTSSCAVRSAVRPNGGGFGNLQTISGALPTSSGAPVVDVSSTGAAVAAWSGAPDGAGVDRVAAAVRPKGGAYGSPVFISGNSDGAIDDTGPAIAAGGRGNAVVLWAHVGSTPSATIRYADYLNAWYRPDALIKKASASSYTGGNVYNTTGQHQIVPAKVSRGHSITFDIKVVNRSSGFDRITIKGPGSKPGFTAKYLAGSSGTTDITSKVLAGSYSPRFAPGTSKVLRLVIKAKAGAIVGTADYWSVKTTSTHDGSRTDVVKASVTVKG